MNPESAGQNEVGDGEAEGIRYPPAITGRRIRIPNQVRRNGEMVDQLTPSSNTPVDSNTLVSWLREVAALRQAA
jgi:hypothetical protein